MPSAAPPSVLPLALPLALAAAVSLTSAACAAPRLGARSAAPAPTDTGADNHGADPLVWRGRSPTSTFFEITDVEVIDELVYTCTGVRGLVVHDLARPETPVVAATLTVPEQSARYPRCTHLSRHGDRLLVVTQRDEVEPEPLLILLDVSLPRAPRVLSVLEVDSSEISFLEGVLTADAAWVAGGPDALWRVPVVDDRLGPPERHTLPGTLSRLALLDADLLVGTSEGVVHRWSPVGGTRWSTPLNGAVQAVLPDVGGTLLTVALGASGLARLDSETGAPAPTHARIDTQGTALRLDHLASGALVVANWEDVRVYDFTEEDPLRAVDAVFEAGPTPRHLAAAGGTDMVYAGEWTGLHALRHHPERTAPELSTSARSLGVAADGARQHAQLVVRNEGLQQLEISRIVAPSPWQADAGRLSLAPDQQATLTLTHPGASAPQTAALVLETNDPDESLAQVQLRVGSDKVFVGDPAPEFRATGINTGAVHELADVRGQVVLLSYFATF